MIRLMRIPSPLFVSLIEVLARNGGRPHYSHKKGSVASRVYSPLQQWSRGKWSVFLSESRLNSMELPLHLLSDVYVGT